MKLLDKLKNLQLDIIYDAKIEHEKLTSYSCNIIKGGINKLVSLESKYVLSYCLEFHTNRSYMIEIPADKLQNADSRKLAKKLVNLITGGKYENITVY